MLQGNQKSFSISNESVMEWMINEEPNLVKKIVAYYLKEELEVSFDSKENQDRLKRVSQYIAANIGSIYSELDQNERFILYVMEKGFGWIVYENVDATVNIISHIYHIDYTGLRQAVDSLLKKFCIFKFERLKRYNFLFTPPVMLNVLTPYLEKEAFNPACEDCEDIREELSIYQYIALIGGIISYVVTNSPRSSETNEIHKIDFGKMTEFFTDFASPERVEKVIVKLSKFGFFEKLNNRIILNNSIMERILSLSINEQLFIIFLYEFMDKFDFRKSHLMTLKILARQTGGMPLRELFFYYLNNEIYLILKNEVKNLKLLLQQEELKFMYFVKTIEAEKIGVIRRSNPKTISVATDTIILNEPHCSLLNNVDFSSQFQGKNFIIEQNYEVIVEPYVKPEVVFKLALLAEPVTIQTISIFRITKESIYRSFAYGFDKNEILHFLKTHSEHEVPENVMQGIEGFLNDLEINRLENYKIIQINSQESHLLKDNFKNKMIEVEPHTFLIFDLNVLKSIEDYCKKNGITVKCIDDFLKGENYYEKMHQSTLVQNIRHLHTMKEFFDFYGSAFIGTKVKIDNEI